MNDRALSATRLYDTSIDRVGLALGAGSLLGGLVVAVLTGWGGQHSPMALVLSWAIGSVFVAIGMTAFGGPIWLVMHLAGLRRPWHAALVGAVPLFVLLAGVQGLGSAPLIDTRDWIVRTAATLGNAALLALLAAAIALVMWRIAYRRVTGG